MAPKGLNTALAGFFGGLSRIRGKRIFHPDGIAYTAAVTAEPRPGLDAELFGSATERPAVVRLSPALSLPAGVPDFAGAAIRILSAYGDGLDQDFLLVSSGRRPILRHLLRPTYGSAAGQWYSSLTPYCIGDQTLILGARTDGSDPPASLALAAAAPRGAWSGIAMLELGEQLSAEASAALAFSTDNSGGGIEPVGFVNSLRPPAYRGSQAGRASADERTRRRHQAAVAHESSDLAR